MMQIYAGCLDGAGTWPAKHRRAKESRVFVREPCVNKKTYNFIYSNRFDENTMGYLCLFKTKKFLGILFVHK